MPATVEWALKYRSLGFSVIACIPPTPDEKGKDQKKPWVEWTEYQKRLATEEEIRGWWKERLDSRIGIVTGELSGLFVIDMDSEEAKQKIEIEYLPDSLSIPICKSPRGGYHYYFRNKNGCRNQTKIDNLDLDTRGEGGFIMAPPSLGLNGTRYTWVKGCEIWNVRPANLPDKLNAYLNQFLLSRARVEYSMGGDASQPSRVTRSHAESRGVTNMFEDGRRDDDLFHTANCLVKGGMRDGNISQVLEKLIISWGEAPDQKWIDDKVNSALKRSERKKANIAEELRSWIGVTQGHFLVTDYYAESRVVTPEEKHAVIVCLNRLKQEGVIERHGERRGSYRVVEGRFESVELKNIDDIEVFDFRLPFGLEKYIELLPKDLIVFSAPPNAGKTAVMLETLRLNMRRHKCFYFSSEMGRHNCKKRLAKHSDCTDWPFKFVDDFPNFIDIVQPDDITFIDYLTDDEGDAYKIPGMLAKIQKKLRNGLAVVALQKNPDTKKQRTDYAVGGQQTKAKPALFVTIDPDYPGAKMRIVKAKNYRDVNPNGFMIPFKIVQGINLLPNGIWEPENE